MTKLHLSAHETELVLFKIFINTIVHFFVSKVVNLTHCTISKYSRLSFDEKLSFSKHEEGSYRIVGCPEYDNEEPNKKKARRCLLRGPDMSILLLKVDKTLLKYYVETQRQGKFSRNLVEVCQYLVF